MSDIILNSVCKNFDGKSVLNGVSLIFKEGEITCIKGPSGCGKTTLLRIIAGLTKVDSGTISGIPERISCVFQENRLCEDFSGVSNILAVTGKTMNKESACLHAYQYACRHLAELELEGCVNEKVKNLSGGMKRRVAIARAVCYNSGLLLLDEPFKGLDEELKKKVIEYIKRHAEGRTIICVTHEPLEAELMGGTLVDLGASRLKPHRVGLLLQVLACLRPDPVFPWRSLAHSSKRSTINLSDS